MLSVVGKTFLIVLDSMMLFSLAINLSMLKAFLPSLLLIYCIIPVAYDLVPCV